MRSFSVLAMWAAEVLGKFNQIQMIFRENEPAQAVPSGSEAPRCLRLDISYLHLELACVLEQGTGRAVWHDSKMRRNFALP